MYINCYDLYCYMYLYTSFNAFIIAICIVGRRLDYEI